MYDDFQEECHLAMIHENMYISHLVIHDQQVEEVRAKRKSRDAKRARSLMVVLQRAGLRLKTSLRLRRGFLIKFLSVYLSLGMIRCLTINLKGKGY